MKIHRLVCSVVSKLNVHPGIKRLLGLCGALMLVFSAWAYCSYCDTSPCNDPNPDHPGFTCSPCYTCVAPVQDATQCVVCNAYENVTCTCPGFSPVTDPMFPCGNGDGCAMPISVSCE